MKLLMCFLISINILIANQTNVVKTSELELFLFKVGFESLLTDVDITKNKSNLNESELKKLNSKIEIIMNELYKDERVLTNDSKNVEIKHTINDDVKKEILTLQNEVTLLKSQINKLLLNKNAEAKKEIIPEINNTKTILLNEEQYKIKGETVNIRHRAFPSAQIVDVLTKGTLVSIEYCNKFGWCKFKNEKKFVSKFLLEK